jgi:hypothetical protein
MRFRRLWPLGLLALALASTGCDSGRPNPPDVVVRALNATANFPDLIFRRGPAELQPMQLSFLGGAQRTWDEDTYHFHVGYGDIQTQTLVEVETFDKQLSTGTWTPCCTRAGSVT